MKNVVLFPALLILATLSLGLQAREPNLKKDNRKAVNRTLNELCAPATAQTDLDLNNVRARVLAAGDMWWNLAGQPRYEVPKGGNRHSMFAGALWLGGLDEGQQLKLAAMTYRQRGNDFWPGPLTEDGTASVTGETCRRYDRFWTITREQVEMHRAWLNCQEDPDCDIGETFAEYEIPQIIREWPGNGIGGELPFKLAPFIDRDDDGIYDPNVDYPAYDLDREFDCRLKEIDVLYGDKTIWWVYNDRGNVHTESQAGALGFEIRKQAFAFSTNDEINSMTFYNYRILNKSTFTLTNTYFSTWFDPDLGNHVDDLIGCDIPRGLGYCYNANPIDAGPMGYGPNPPAIALDFFQGPFADYFNGLDDDRDGCVDGVRDSAGVCIPENRELGINERIIMSGFMYYNNGATWTNTNMTDPSNAAEFYNYMRCFWKNGTPLVIDNPSGLGNSANGTGFRNDASGERTMFAFPGLSYDTTGNFQPDTSLPNGGWWESPANLADKRGLHTAGPFTLEPGALNFITTGAVWARNFTSDDIFASMRLVIIADDKAQSLFDNCFQLLDGPDAPLMEIEEFDQELVIKLSYPESSNNFNLSYTQVDPLIPDQPGWTDAQVDSARQRGYYEYRFEGFQIFQFANSGVTAADLYDPDKSRLVFQCDIRNQHSQLINWERVPELNNALVPQDMTLESGNNGIRTTFRVTDDAFSTTGNRALINHREYYYYAVAYAVNQYRPFLPAEPDITQQTPYLAGRRGAFGGSIPTVTAIPHKTEMERDGLTMASRYGDTPEITRIEGMGNSGNFLELTPQTEEQILANNSMDFITFQRNAGPINVKVVNPKEVKPGNFTVRLTGTSSNSNWILEGMYEEDGEVRTIEVQSDTTLAFENEQIIAELGLSVTMLNAPVPAPDEDCSFEGGIIGAQRIYSNSQFQWLSGVPDDDSFTPLNWSVAGTSVSAAPGSPAETYRDVVNDPCGYFTMIGNSWAPYIVTRPIRRDLPTTQGYGPAAGNTRPSLLDAENGLARLQSVDVVITADRSKWTRVPVFEMAEDPQEAQGGGITHRLRQADGWDLGPNGLVRSTNPAHRGWSYFPGYAIDIESGKRLNMAFGENSWLVGENGADMLWNPTARVFRQFDIAMGGMHYLYVFGSERIEPTVRVPVEYRGDDPLQNPFYDQIQSLGSGSVTGRFWRAIMYTHVPLLSPAFANVNPYENIPSEVRFKIRTNKAFTNFVTDNSNGGNPKWQFSTDDIAAGVRQREVANEALDLIGVVPNPYFAFSRYEDSQLDNIVKIINLPERCNVNIFTTGGALVRSFRKDNTDTFLQWDLRNDSNVPITSGMYIIHVDAGDIGQKVVKWFGAMRPVDLNAF